jgi:hypothetical protein
MRGSRQPAVRQTTTETQTAFRTFSRGRRSKLAKLAHTTLLKADQWARGDVVPGGVSEASEGAIVSLKAKKK